MAFELIINYVTWSLRTQTHKLGFSSPLITHSFINYNIFYFIYLGLIQSRSFITIFYNMIIYHTILYHNVNQKYINRDMWCINKINIIYDTKFNDQDWFELNKILLIIVRFRVYANWIKQNDMYSMIKTLYPSHIVTIKAWTKNKLKAEIYF